MIIIKYIGKIMDHDKIQTPNYYLIIRTSIEIDNN